MHTIYREFVGTSVRSAVDRARACSGIDHAGVKGTIREILVADLLRPLLPADIGIGTGNVISADGAGFWDHRAVKGWSSFPSGNLDEVIHFVAQVGNSFRRVLDTRGKPRIGLYLR